MKACGVDSVEGFEKQENSTPKDVEWVLNYIHLADLHDGVAGLGPDKLVIIGNIMKEMWEAKLRLQFPNRPCTVELNVPDNPNAFWNYQLSF